MSDVTEETVDEAEAESEQADDYDAWTQDDLHDELAARELHVSGTKDEQIERLRANDRGEDDQGDDESAGEEVTDEEEAPADEPVMTGEEVFIVIRKFEGDGAVRFPGELLVASAWPQGRASQLMDARYIRPYPSGLTGVQDVHGRQYASGEAKLEAAEYPEYGPADEVRTQQMADDPVTESEFVQDYDPLGMDAPLESVPDFDPNATPEAAGFDADAALTGDVEVGDEGDEAEDGEDEDAEDEAYNPSEHAVLDVQAYVEENEITGDDLVNLRQAEADQKDRVTLISWLDDMIASEMDEDEDEE